MTHSMSASATHTFTAAFHRLTGPTQGRYRRISIREKSQTRGAGRRLLPIGTQNAQGSPHSGYGERVVDAPARHHPRQMYPSPSKNPSVSIKRSFERRTISSPDCEAPSHCF